MQLSLVVREGTVVQAGFNTYGCPAAVACGNLVCELSTGRDVSKLLNISSRDLILLLGGLPDVKTHCADLAIGSLRDALRGQV
jgi:nitrogen fixation NifU-like protein